MFALALARIFWRVPCRGDSAIDFPFLLRVKRDIGQIVHLGRIADQISPDGGVSPGGLVRKGEHISMNGKRSGASQWAGYHDRRCAPGVGEVPALRSRRTDEENAEARTVRAYSAFRSGLQSLSSITEGQHLVSSRMTHHLS